MARFFFLLPLPQSRQWDGASVRTRQLMCVLGGRARPDCSRVRRQPRAGRDTPQILMWEMGGAGTVLPVATAARRARTQANSTATTPYFFCGSRSLSPFRKTA